MKVQDNVMFTPIWTVPPYQDKSKTEINLQCTDLNVQGELFNVDTFKVPKSTIWFKALFSTDSYAIVRLLTVIKISIQFHLLSKDWGILQQSDFASVQPILCLNLIVEIDFISIDFRFKIQITTPPTCQLAASIAFASADITLAFWHWTTVLAISGDTWKKSSHLLFVIHYFSVYHMRVKKDTPGHSHTRVKRELRRCRCGQLCWLKLKRICSIKHTCDPKMERGQGRPHRDRLGQQLLEGSQSLW